MKSEFKQDTGPGPVDREIPAPAEGPPVTVPAPTRPRPWTAWLIHGIKLTVAVGLLVLLVRTIRVAALEEALSGASLSWVLAALPLALLNIWLQVERWRTAVRGEMPEIGRKKVLASFLGGVSLGIITPGRVGEIGRVFLLKPDSRVRLAGLHMLDKLYFLAALACFGPAMLYHMPGFANYLPEGTRLPLLIATSVLPLFYLAFAASPAPLRSLLVLIRRRFPGKGSASQLFHALDRITPANCRWMATLTVAQFAVILTEFHFISRAFQPVSWLTAAHTYLASLFVKSLLPISLGDLGVSEWAAVSLYQRYGIADTTAFSASLIIFGMNILLPALAGIFVLQKVKTGDVLNRVSRRLRRSR